MFMLNYTTLLESNIVSNYRFNYNRLQLYAEVTYELKYIINIISKIIEHKNSHMKLHFITRQNILFVIVIHAEPRSSKVCGIIYFENAFSP